MRRAIRYAAQCGKFLLHAAVGSAVIAMVCGSWITIGSIFDIESCTGPRSLCHGAVGFLVMVIGGFLLSITAAIGRVTLSFIDDKVDDYKNWRRSVAYRRSIGAYQGSATKGQP